MIETTAQLAPGLPGANSRWCHRGSADAATMSLLAVDVRQGGVVVLLVVHESIQDLQQGRAVHSRKQTEEIRNFGRHKRWRLGVDDRPPHTPSLITRRVSSSAATTLSQSSLSDGRSGRLRAGRSVPRPLPAAAVSSLHCTIASGEQSALCSAGNRASMAAQTPAASFLSTSSRSCCTSLRRCNGCCRRGRPTAGNHAPTAALGSVDPLLRRQHARTRRAARPHWRPHRADHRPEGGGVTRSGKRSPVFAAWMAALARGPVCERWRSQFLFRCRQATKQRRPDHGPHPKRLQPKP
jgi:hypothetical protein